MPAFEERNLPVARAKRERVVVGEAEVVAVKRIDDRAKVVPVPAKPIATARIQKTKPPLSIPRQQ